MQTLAYHLEQLFMPFLDEAPAQMSECLQEVYACCISIPYHQTIALVAATLPLFHVILPYFRKALTLLLGTSSSFLLQLNTLAPFLQLQTVHNNGLLTASPLSDDKQHQKKLNMLHAHEGKTKHSSIHAKQAHCLSMHLFSQSGQTTMQMQMAPSRIHVRHLQTGEQSLNASTNNQANRSAHLELRSTNISGLGYDGEDGLEKNDADKGDKMKRE